MRNNDTGIAVLAALLIASSLPAQVPLRSQKHGNSEAKLVIQVADRPAERGLGEVTYTLTVKGPETLEVEEPHLGDAAAAWKEERQSSQRKIDNGRVTWSEVIRLKQSKKGIEALPDVALRFRDGPQTDWGEARWVDILKTMRDLPDPEAPAEPQPSWLRRWGLLLTLAAVVLLLLLAWLLRRRRIRREAPLPPDQWALRELARIETTLMPPQGEAETYHTQISYVVRRYLAERFGLHALQQTTAEFLEAVRQLPQVTAEQQTLLHKATYQGSAKDLHRQLTPEQQALASELFERCDLAKFAPVNLPPEECRRSAELARELVRQTQ